ncbi:MAG: hypothetical protein ACRBB6_15585 [Neptuniibacter sp.]
MRVKIFIVALGVLSIGNVSSADLEVGKICPVLYQKEPIGHLVFSKEWYHSGRSDASYTPRDNATGVGLEIHLFNNQTGHLSGQNIAQCDRYRLIQIRRTNARLFRGEKKVQIDVPDHFLDPFYDSSPLEHGYGVHQTPKDSQDKPWQGRPVRSSTVAIYDTPYVSDSYGIEGKDITVQFETCVVCERDRQYDNVLSCGSWGYKREYMGGMTGWAEPDFTGVQCHVKPSEQFQHTLNNSNRIEYSYWINWR